MIDNECQTCRGTSRLLCIFISAPVGVRDLVKVVRIRFISQIGAVKMSRTHTTYTFKTTRLRIGHRNVQLMKLSRCLWSSLWLVHYTHARTHTVHRVLWCGPGRSFRAQQTVHGIRSDGLDSILNVCQLMR